MYNFGVLINQLKKLSETKKEKQKNYFEKSLLKHILQLDMEISTCQLRVIKYIQYVNYAKTYIYIKYLLTKTVVFIIYITKITVFIVKLYITNVCVEITEKHFLIKHIRLYEF